MIDIAKKDTLPTGWKWVNLVEVGVFEAGGTPAKECDGFWNGEVPFVTGADITELNITQSNARAFLTQKGLSSGKTAVCEENTVLIVTRTRVGRVGIARERMGASQDITAFKCNSKINAQFLCSYLHNISQYLIDNCRGATIQGLTREFVSNIQIPLPPLSEQIRIVKVLNQQISAVETARQAAQQQLEATTILPEAYIRSSLVRQRDLCSRN